MLAEDEEESQGLEVRAEVQPKWVVEWLVERWQDAVGALPAIVEGALMRLVEQFVAASRALAA